ncbi:MAG: hypothetical protein K2K12_06645, partial [Clostridia bacterium]|nr:hypothetical protein [Clostridia bacterium]
NKMKRLIKNRVFIGIILAVCVAALIWCSILLPFAGKKKMSEAASGIGSLTFDDYDTRTDGNIFNGDELKKLFGAMTGSTNEDKTATLKEATDAVQNSSSSVTGNPNYGGTLTEPNSMNYAQLKSNAGETITVQFGGFTWNVVYATIAGGDLVATLWQSGATGSSQWNGYAVLDTSNPYPSCMYSTSKIRMVALNGGTTSGSTQYATSTTQLGGTVTETQRKNNQYAAFTLDKNTIGQKSLVDYLVTPGQVGYQADENWAWSYFSANFYMCPNDALGTPSLGSWCPGGQGVYDMSPIPQKTNYYNWASDYVWLPSLTETGYVAGASLWGIPQGDSVAS